jgi:hypothetical protein
MRINNGLRRFSSPQAVEQLHQACLVRITHGRFAIWLDPFGMLNPEVVVNLLPELGVGVDLMMRGRCRGETFVGGTGWSVQLASFVSALRSETNEFHKRLSVSRLTAPNPRGNEEHPYELLSAASLQLPSRLQVNLEIAQAVSQRRLSSLNRFSGG